MACTVVFVEGKNDYAFFGHAFSDKSFKPLEFGQEWSEREAASCENAVSDTRRFFKGKPRQLFGSRSNRVMLIQSDGKQKAERHFEMVSKEIGMNSVADMRSLLVIDSDAAPEPEKIRGERLESLARRLEETGMNVKFDPADSGKMTSACTASGYRKNLRAGVMTVPTNFEEIFAAFLARHYAAARDNPPKIAIAKTIEDLGVVDVDGLCGHVFAKLRTDVKQDPKFSQMLKELCEFVHG